MMLTAKMRALVIAALALFATGCTTSSVITAPYEPPTARYAAIVIDAKSGKVLHNTRADAIRFPASLTKMMTMYMAFEALSRRRISLNSEIPVSSYAASKPASKLYLKAGETINVDTALQALAVKSANDVATAMAEFLGGSEATFARMMTARARSLGMRSTTFRNASGLPDRLQVTTARDMATLSLALQKRYPQYFHYFGKSTFVWKGKTIRGHNRVLGMLKGANGIKTGYTRASGFNLATSVKRPNKHLVGVILGEDSGKVRNRHMVELLKAFGA
ncbi:D-alanyl-D-alanine carboxypeptidase family protein [Ahrensia sp. R2A130]|uniref:D-alanyl-D-alanine carboxypeptidase family protein n=1 Tax=Ahrensia sp. R2A130 TaxID=744979 RepID=UPI00058E203A|nr:D-alanyl-D-alanine carboxypeptidase family protein [Ahrensia sp. R2A130]